MVLERKSAKVTHVGDFLDRLFPILREARSRLIPKIYSRTPFEIYLSNSYKIKIEIKRHRHERGTAVAQSLSCCAINRKVAGSIPAGFTGIFH